MDSRRWRRIEETFLGALERPEEQRPDYLKQACAGDEDLRAEVETLLRDHARQGGIMDDPPLRLPPDAVPDEEIVGQYRLNSLLGRGGMGEVYLATQVAEGFRRPVALKVIKRGMDTEAVLRRFQLERRILASLSHPNIAQLLDAGATDDGRPYFVMEYVDGVPLDEYCDREVLSIPERIEIFLAVCDAVQHAHQNLVVHRDLKPGNVLVTPEGVPKLLDFGIGKIVDLEGGAGPAMTTTGVRVLTPEYASPEQLTGEAITVASDIYTLGIVLFELLTGRHPMARADASLASFERAVLEEDVPRPSATVGQAVPRPDASAGDPVTPEMVSWSRGTDPRRLRRSLAGDLDNIVLKALHRDPGRRYPSVSALADDLRRHLEGRPVRARPDTFAYRAGKFVRRHRLSLGAAAMVFLTMAGATVYSLEQSERVARERDQALEVESFLLEMFGQSAPDAETGDAVTARQLLDRQVAALEGYADRPELEARMTRVLAEGYDRLGLYPEATELADRALTLYRSALPGDDPAIARTLGLLGWIRHESGESEEGEELLLEAIPIWRAAGDGGGLSRALNDLGVIREAAGDYTSADTLYAEALELRRGEGASATRSFAITASNLSVVRYRQGRFPEAVATAREALEAMRAVLGPDHQRSIIIQSNLAAMQVAMGDIEGASAAYVDLLERQRRLQGPDHPVTLRVLASLAATHLELGRFAEAEAAYREVMEGQEAQLGADHPQVALAASRLGQALTEQGKADEAMPVLERALSVLEGRFGDAHLAVTETLEALADAHEVRGDLVAAEAYHRRALDGVDEAVGADNHAAARVRMRFGDRLFRAGRAEEALPFYAEAHEILLQSLGPEHNHTLRTRLRMAQMHLLLGETAAADSLLAAAAAADPSGDHGGYRTLFDSLTAELAGG